MKEMELEAVLEMAIGRERAAQGFYRQIADKVDDESIRDSLLFLAAQERSHEEALEQYRAGQGPEGGLGMKHPIDGAVVEHLGPPDSNVSWKPEDAFLAAAERERRAHDFYLALAQKHEQGATRELLERLAREELAHKEKVEYLYANTAFPQTDGG